MDIKSFLQSGLLEAYVAGLCSDAERREVEDMAARHPEVKAELEKIELALEKMAQANAVPPPAGLRDRILQNLDEKPGTDSGASSTARTAGSSRLYQWIALAALLMAGYFWWLHHSESRELNSLRNESAALKEKVDECAKRRERSDQMATLLRDTDTHPVVLSDGKSSFNIVIFNNKLRKECALDISGVPVATDGKYLQAWAVVAGNPVSLGMIDMNAPAGWQPLPYIENAEAYAISEEKSPQGNPRPTIVIANGLINGDGPG